MKWNERFGSRMANGATVDQAIAYADGFSDYYDNTAQRSSTRYGNGNTKLTNTRSLMSSAKAEQEDAIVLNSSQITFNKEERNFSAITSALKSQISDLDSEKYQPVMAEISDEEYYVDLVEYVDGYETSSAVSVHFYNGVAVETRDNRIEGDRSSLKAPRTPNQNDIAAAYETASQKLTNAGYEIVEQYGKAVYDIDNDKFVYRVFTTYSSNGLLGGDVTDYEII